MAHIKSVHFRIKPGVAKAISGVGDLKFSKRKGYALLEGMSDFDGSNNVDLGLDIGGDALQDGTVVKETPKIKKRSRKIRRNSFKWTRTRKGYFKCKNCKYYASKRSNLLRHVKNAHGDGVTDANVSNEANSLPENPDSAKINDQKLNKTQPNAQKIFPCPKCPYKSNQKGNLKTHYRAIHEPKTFTCNYCSYQASKKSNLRTHVAAVHLNVRKHACNLCSFRSAQKGNLKAHYRAVHDGSGKNEPLGCTLCGFQTSQRTALAKHLRVAHGSIDKRRKIEVLEFLSRNPEVSIKLGPR